MNSNVSLLGIMTGIGIAASAALAFLVNPSSFLLKFVDFMFLISLPFVIVGGFLFIIERGAFNITRYAFRKTFNKKEASLIEEEEEQPLDNKELLYRTYSFRLTYPILLTGIVLAVISTIMSVTVFV